MLQQTTCTRISSSRYFCNSTKGTDGWQKHDLLQLSLCEGLCSGCDLFFEYTDQNRLLLDERFQFAAVPFGLTLSLYGEAARLALSGLRTPAVLMLGKIEQLVLTLTVAVVC